MDDWGSVLSRGKDFFFFTTASRPAMGFTQPPMQWILGVLSLGLKWLWNEDDCSPPSSAEVKNAWSYTSTLQSTLSWHCT